jgi:hypothetical protein
MKFLEQYIPKKAAKLGMSPEDFLSGKDYLGEGQQSRRRYGSEDGEWVDFLTVTAAKKDKSKSKKKDSDLDMDKDPHTGKGHSQVETDEFDEGFSRKFWKTFKKGKK